MQTDYWLLLKKLFQETLERKPEERAAFLEEACHGNQNLRNEIEALLTADGKAGEFMESPPVVEVDPEPNGNALIHSKIGQYLIEQVISSGGMGTVYRAVQESPRRPVAIKVMRRGIASKSALRRFEYESEILARLTHPNIAHVIEAGTYSPDKGSGTPYFVMEYVPDALSITDYAWQNKLSIRKRMDLFTQVCDAVHHGHQKGIIHRDLKPSNILVNASGQVKIIDFGIARVTDLDFHLTTAKTDVGQLIGTVQYMSPEQCRANPDDLDIRSDVYGLGVVLYELLCEKLPYDVRKAVIFEATRIIRETEPSKPSTTNRALRGDVETILLKALEKDRDQRYQTVADLAMDIRRFLKGEVILARPAGPSTRAIKYAKRNPVKTTALLVGFSATLIFLGYSFFVYTPRIWYERDVAEREKLRAIAAEQHALEARKDADLQREAALEAKALSEQEEENTKIINRFLEEMLVLADPFKEGRDIKMQELLDKAVERIDREFPDRPEIEASLRNTLGYTYIDFGAYTAAEIQLQKAFDLRVRILGERNEDTLSTQNWLGLALLDQGKFAEAEPLLRKSLEASRDLLGKPHPVTLQAMNSLSTLLLSQSQYSEAEQLLRDALLTGRTVLGENHKMTLSSMYTLGNLLHLKGELDEAESILKEVIEIRTRTIGDNHPDTLNVMNSLGNVLLSRSDYSAAETLYVKIIESYRKTLGEEHPFTLGVMNNLANVYICQDLLQKAEACHREVYGIRRRVLGEEHPDTLKSLNNVAVLLDRQSKNVESEAIHRQLLETRTRVWGEEHESTLNSMEGLALVLIDLDQVPEAESLLRKALKSRLKICGEQNPVTIRTWKYLADILKRQEQFEEAEELYLRGIEAANGLYTNPNVSLASLHVKYGDCLRLMKRFDNAERYLLQGFESYKECVGMQHRWTRSVVMKLIELYEDWKKPEALKKWQEILDE
ncbi:MAG: tetratricopeptide repeat protein [Planctomycetota bacterium]